MRLSRPLAFHVFWRLTQVLLVGCLLVAVYGTFDEYSLRRYLAGFSDAVVPLPASPEQKVEAILAWMRAGPARRPNVPDDFLANRDPQDTLNYGQLLRVCGTATNAFVNLAASGGLHARRLLLLDATRQVKHVVAEVRLGERWVVVDPSLRTLFRDRLGRPVTREQLANPAMLQEVTRNVPDYPADFTYESTAHVHLSRIPVVGKYTRGIFDKLAPGWEEDINWTLPLERKSFGLILLSLLMAGICLLTRVALGRYAQMRLGIEPVSMHAHLARFGRALLSRNN